MGVRVSTDNERAVAIVEDQAVTIFGSGSMDEVKQKVLDLAHFVSDIVTRGNLTSNISGRTYVNVEGWQAAGMGVGLSVHIESVESTGPMDGRGQCPGYIARASLRSRDGGIVATAESSCERDEPTWRNRPNYALRSMVQTRVTGKLYRQVLGFVMVIAGYEGTPAEEMPELPAPDDRGAPTTPARSAPTRARTAPVNAARTPSATVRNDGPTAPGSTWADMVHYVMEQHGVDGEAEREMVLLWAHHAGVLADPDTEFREAVRIIGQELAQRRWGPDQIIGSANDFFAVRDAMREEGRQSTMDEEQDEPRDEPGE